MITEDDALAADACMRCGVTWCGAAWDDPGVDWSRFDAIVLRSTWNYHLRVGDFLRWYQALSENSVVLNSFDLVSWNSDKRYLLPFAEAGFAIPCTAVVKQGERASLSQLLHRYGWDVAVIKPAVSASAFGTTTVVRETASTAQVEFEGMVKNFDVLVQEFVPEIRSAGEMSLMFFDGKFSHAVMKFPAAEDFRVQEHAGGRVVAAEPSPAVISSASSILRFAAGSAPLYARVDGVVTNDKFILMELELIEPSLFFCHSNSAADRFAAALADRLERHQA